MYSSENYVRELLSTYGSYPSAIYAIYFSKSRAALLKGEINYPTEHQIIYTQINGVHVPPPPRKKPILIISGGEGANPKLEELELSRMTTTKIFHNRNEPLKQYLKHKSCEIDFDGEFKSEVQGLEEIFEYLADEKRINVQIQNTEVNQLISKPHYRYCTLLILRECKGRLI